MDDKADRQELLERAQDAARLGDYVEAKETLRMVVATWPNWAPAWHVLAIVTLKLEQLDEGLEYARRSAQMSPKSRKVSKVLFNALWQTTIHTGNANFAYEAMVELNRMLSMRESPDHRNAALEIRQQFSGLQDAGVRSGLLAAWNEQLAQFFQD